jgi:peptidoglycan hydrolase-like protein with peptidoglycan-binding domain
VGTAAGMIAQARALLGLGQEPPKSNHNRITSWYGVDAAWCDMSISYEAAHSGNLPAVMGKFAWTVAHARAFQARGRWHYGLGGVRAGDVVFFDWLGTRSIADIDHVGLVEAVHSDGTITTLEGNTSDAFRRRARNSACVVGYGRPVYDDAAPLPPTDGMLRRGSHGDAVRTLQGNLNTVMTAGLSVDGDFGPGTEAALVAFQRRYGISADGEYGPQSAAMMTAALAGRSTLIKPTPMPPSPPSGPVAPPWPGREFRRTSPEMTGTDIRTWQQRMHGRGWTISVDGGYGPQSESVCRRFQQDSTGHGWPLQVDGAVGRNTWRASWERPMS